MCICWLSDWSQAEELPPTSFLDSKQKARYPCWPFFGKMRNNDTHFMGVLWGLNEFILVKHLKLCQHKVKLKSMITIFIKLCFNPQGKLHFSSWWSNVFASRSPEVLGGAPGSLTVLVNKVSHQLDLELSGPASSVPEFRYNLRLSELVLRSWNLCWSTTRGKQNQI